MVLETHVVYSLSREKTAARFYIMQGTQSLKKDNQFPLQDLIQRLVLVAAIFLIKHDFYSFL